LIHSLHSVDVFRLLQFLPVFVDMALVVSVVSVIKYNNNTLHVGKCINSSKDKYVIEVSS